MPRLEDVTKNTLSSIESIHPNAHLATPLEEMKKLCDLLVSCRATMAWAETQLCLHDCDPLAEKISVEIMRLDSSMDEAASRLDQWFSRLIEPAGN